MSDTTITMSDMVGGDVPVGSILSVYSGTSSGSNYLITAINSATTMTIKKWAWWFTVLMWNPCNDILDLLGLDQ